jgi:septal ring factor EnvC (AmiA/AmiB activator)
MNTDLSQYEIEKEKNKQLQSQLAAKEKEIAELKAKLFNSDTAYEFALVDITELKSELQIYKEQTTIRAFKYEKSLQAIRAQEPVLWIQSNHLQKLGQSDMCRCSNFKLMSDYVPLYAHPIKEVMKWQMK